MSAAGAIIGTAGNMLTSMINNMWASDMASQDRYENYRYGEMAAQNADRRTRALYNDFYSPQALLRQYNEAGLSPSLMFGGTPGQGGMAGAQGTGAAGPQTHFAPMSLVDAAQAAALFAQADKTKEETKNVAEDTQLKILQQDWQSMLNTEKNIEFELTTMAIDKNGKQISLYELANDHDDYEKFMKEVRELAISAPGGNLIIRQMSTEKGQEVMRKIFMDSNKFERDIKVLSEEGVSADFQKKLMQLLKKEGFLEANAQTAVKELQAAGEAADLTKEQKQAFNNIIEKLRKKSDTTADIIILVSMILGQAMSRVSVSKKL